MSISNSIARNAAQFSLGALTRSYEKDGKQQAQLTFFLWQRERLLAGELQQAGFVFKHFGLISMYLAFVETTLFIASHIDQLPYFKEKYNVTVIKSTANEIQSILAILLNRSDTLWNLAYLTFSIAMIALGHQTIGTIGLVTSFLTYLKTQNRIPYQLEQLFSHLIDINAIYSCFLEPNLYLRYLSVFFNLLFLDIDLLRNNTTANFLLGECSPGTHNYSKIETFPSSFCLPDELILNQTSVHALAVGKILPPHAKEDLQNQSFETLYKNIEAQMITLELQYDEEGWNRIKQAMQLGVLSEGAPSNFETFQQILQTTLFSVLEETDLEIQKQKIQELAKIGSSCPEGWTRDLSYLYNPRSKDIAWSVHTKLAKLRDDLVSAALLDLQKSTPELFDIAGKVNNVHLHNQFSAILWPKWRTYRGELYFELKGRSLFTRFLQKPLNIFLPQQFKDYLLSICHLEVSSAFLREFPGRFIDPYLSETYTPSLIESTIFEAIKPEYRQVKNAYESRREIEWDPICSWLAATQDKGLEILNKDGSYKTKWVAYTELNQPYLTREAVRLLLLDLGVFSIPTFPINDDYFTKTPEV